MSLMTNPVAVAMRGLLRRLGLTRLIATMIYARDYEEAYEAALFAEIHPGDHVWDVGANRGHYAERFADRVGRSGRIDCFEPSPPNAAALETAVGADETITVHRVALSDHEGTASFHSETGASGVNDRLAPAGDGSIEVALRRAASVISETGLVPAVVKIDVEGHELAVLEGFGTYLSDPALRCLGVEVHFAQMTAQGIAQGPKRLETQLRAAGFHVRWPDPSHIVATRRDGHSR